MSMSLDLILHMAGLAFVMGMWFAAIAGAAQVLRVLGFHGRTDAARDAEEGAAAPAARRVRARKEIARPAVISRVFAQAVAR